VTVATTYRAIGVVESPISEALRPELMRRVEARLVLRPDLAAAVATLKEGTNVWVIYHLHEAEAWHEAQVEELFGRRMACRPNPIGVTLTRVVEAHESTITVIGLDAVDGSPILDIKPYKPIFDAPPVEPGEHQP
jgi:tRNA (Thr-GGU) A37 N-methylase